MVTIKCLIFLTILSVPVLFASDKERDTSWNTAADIDSASVSAAGVDSGKTDSTLADSLLATVNAKRETEKPEEITQPELEIVSSQFVEFFKKALIQRQDELLFNARFIVLGKAVYGHFDFMMVGDSGTVIGTVSTDDRSYRSDKGGRPKTFSMNIGAAANCILVKVAFHEMRKDPEKGLCVTKK